MSMTKMKEKAKKTVMQGFNVVNDRHWLFSIRGDKNYKAKCSREYQVITYWITQLIMFIDDIIVWNPDFTLAEIRRLFLKLDLTKF